MNLLSDYQKKICAFLKKLDNKKIISIPNKLQGLTVELPPKNEKAVISCNAALILSKYNKTSPRELGEILKKHLLVELMLIMEVQWLEQVLGEWKQCTVKETYHCQVLLM